MPLNAFPSPTDLWQRYCTWKGLTPEQTPIVEQDYHLPTPDKQPRYYQEIAINRATEAIAKGQDRILLVMATGTGKTFVASQIIWRLWKSGAKKRILFLADRNILVDQASVNDFKHFAGAMTKIENRKVDKSYEIYLALYQAVAGTEDWANIYQSFSHDFFDLVIVDECHRGSAADVSNWLRILEYFSGATQIGLTATLEETRDVSNIDYFGDPVYTSSLKQGIADGFLAPYKVNRVRKTNYFARYGPQARAGMGALPDKYADQGLESLESPDVLKVIPFPQIGTPLSNSLTLSAAASNTPLPSATWRRSFTKPADIFT